MNKLLKSLIASAFMVSLAAPVAAEGLSEKGVMVGFSMANASGDDADAADSSSVSGFAVGGFGVMELSANLGVRAEAWFIQKGYEVLSSPVSLGYIEVPVMAQYKMPVSGLDINLFGGPFMSYLVSADNDGTDVKDSFKSMDYGIQAGVGAVIQQQYTVDLRYSMGLSEIVDGGNTDVKNSGILLSGGYLF